MEGRLGEQVRFAFRHFPLTEVHPHALAASAAAEAAALQGRFWEMHELLFRRQHALEDDDLERYAAELGLDPSHLDQIKDTLHHLPVTAAATLGRSPEASLRTDLIRDAEVAQARSPT